MKYEGGKRSMPNIQCRMVRAAVNDHGYSRDAAQAAWLQIRCGLTLIF
jgi:hypothetical protein